VSADGVASRVAERQLSAWTADRTVAIECAPDEVRCDLVARSRAGDEELGRSPLSRAVIDNGAEGVLSPSGRTAAVIAYTNSGPSLVLVHLDGTDAVSYAFAPGPWGGGFGGVGPPVWWIDDTLLCGLEEPGGVRCWRDGDLQATFQLGDLGASGFSSIAISRG
jgi:hypothetical protein